MSEYVFQNEDDGLWYFYDESSMSQGPFETQEDANDAYVRYCLHM